MSWKVSFRKSCADAGLSPIGNQDELLEALVNHLASTPASKQSDDSSTASATAAQVSIYICIFFLWLSLFYQSIIFIVDLFVCFWIDSLYYLFCLFFGFLIRTYYIFLFSITVTNFRNNKYIKLGSWRDRYRSQSTWTGSKWRWLFPLIYVLTKFILFLFILLFFVLQEHEAILNMGCSAGQRVNRASPVGLLRKAYLKLSLLIHPGYFYYFKENYSHLTLRFSDKLSSQYKDATKAFQVNRAHLVRFTPFFDWNDESQRVCTIVRLWFVHLNACLHLPSPTTTRHPSEERVRQTADCA